MAKKRHAQVEYAEKAAEMKAAAEQGSPFPAREPRQRQPRVRQRPHHRTRDKGANGDDDAPQLHPQQELLGFPELKLLGIPYSRPHIWRLVAAGNFPKPIKFGAGRNCRCLFRRADIQAWIDAA